MTESLTLGVRRPAIVGAIMPGIVPIVFEIPNIIPACLQKWSYTGYGHGKKRSVKVLCSHQFRYADNQKTTNLYRVW